MEHIIFVISAPSGTGKTTIQKILKNELKDIDIITTFTTRKPRPGEENGIDYIFVDEKEFKEMIKKDKFAEWSIVYGNYYGTPKEKIEENLKNKKKTLLVIDIQGGLKIKKKFPSVYLIGILPPSLKEQEKRLRKRNDMTEEEIKKRLLIAKKERKYILKYYHSRLINKDIRTTVEKIKKIILNN
ncbi:MAG: guanylate kinase [bacterium]|nr:guanylate kinase [bacterium]